MIHIQGALQDRGPTTDICRVEAEAIEDVVCTMGVQEAFYGEKAWIQWLELGGRGTRFSILAAKIKASRSKISGMFIDIYFCEDEVTIANRVCAYSKKI